MPERFSGSSRRSRLPPSYWRPVPPGLRAAAGAAPPAAAVGPELLRVVFGDEVRIGAGPAAVVAAGSVVAVTNLVLMSMVIAKDRSATAVGAWVTATVAAAAAFVAQSATQPLDQVVWAFLVAQAWACGFLLVQLGRRDQDRRPEAEVEAA